MGRLIFDRGDILMSWTVGLLDSRHSIEYWGAAGAFKRYSLTVPRPTNLRLSPTKDD